MKEQLITRETALLAKKKGLLKDSYLEETTHAIAVSQSILQRWLREKHGKLLIVLPWRDHQCDVNDPYTFRPMIVGVKTWGEYKTYEEALEVGLQEALKLLP